MKKKSLLRMGAVLLSYGFMINAMNVNTGMVVMAEEFSADEDTEPEDTTLRGGTQVQRGLKRTCAGRR